MTRVLAILAFILVWTPTSAGADDAPGRFDYYVLALSWSPTHCATEGRGRQDLQCSGARPFAFVLHGLWPQFEKGWPERCARDNWVPEDVIRSMLDIMPARGLVIHQYRTHGTCSGLDPGAYFDLARRAFESVRIPARYVAPTAPITVSPQQIESDFIKTNPEIGEDAIAIACGGNRLREVRICLTRTLRPRACGANTEQRRLCALDAIVMPPVRAH